jgi:hypothetical protein
MALALRFEGLIRTGQILNYAELARLGHVSRARISQITCLLLLAPDIQEELLFLPPIDGRGGAKELKAGAARAIIAPPRVPRVSRLMALAIRLDSLVRTGQVKSYGALGRLGQVTITRVSQS